MEYILTLMEPNMLENGKMISKMVWEYNNGLMARSTKDSIKMAQKLERVF